MPAVRWRWDQGRGEYHQFNNVQAIAKALLKLEGVSLSMEPDPLREVLQQQTHLPYSPSRYKVWRNYKRVFGLALLATEQSGKLICTDVCRKVAAVEDSALTPDEYIWHLAHVHYFPSPVFEGYATKGDQVFPFLAVLKLLAAKGMAGKGTLNTEEVLGRLVGNNVSGREAVGTIAVLPDSGYRGQGDEVRQVREMLRFISQLSFVKWRAQSLILDTAVPQKDLPVLLSALDVARVAPRLSSASAELLAMGRLDGADRVEVPKVEVVDAPGDAEFIEGSRRRATHLRVERSAALRDAFFNALQGKHKCDMCALHPPQRYPWVERLLELHHLLPLGSGVVVGPRRTEFEDMVPLCPNCHRAVHVYYRQWLREAGREDFVAKAEAVEAYKAAKKRVA